MSQGFGDVQQAVLDVFRKEGSGQALDSVDVTTHIHGEHTTRSQHSSTRRALSSLENRVQLIRLERQGFFAGRSRYILAPEDYVRKHALLEDSERRSTQPFLTIVVPTMGLFGNPLRVTDAFPNFYVGSPEIHAAIVEAAKPHSIPLFRWCLNVIFKNWYV